MFFEMPEGKEIALKFSGNKALLAMSHTNWRHWIRGLDEHQVFGRGDMTYAYVV
jgi:hypothetical protein